MQHSRKRVLYFFANCDIIINKRLVIISKTEEYSMKRNENIKMDQYLIRLDFTDDQNSLVPRFSTGKLYHIIQNVCKNYAGSFSIRKIDGGYVYSDGVFKETAEMHIKVNGVTENEADMIAADLCAFFEMDKVTVGKQVIEYHTVEEQLSEPSDE